jgi:hypothetical protein
VAGARAGIRKASGAGDPDCGFLFQNSLVMINFMFVNFTYGSLPSAGDNLMPNCKAILFPKIIFLGC